MKNTRFWEIRQRYLEYRRTHRAPKKYSLESIKYYMEWYMYSIGLDLNNLPQEYINKYIDTLDAFNSITLPEDEIEADKVLDKLMLDCFGIHPSWNDFF